MPTIKRLLIFCISEAFMSIHKDRRKINKVWQACNYLGEWSTYAIVGSGKNSFVATLSNGAMAEYYQKLVGTEYFNV